MAVTVTVNPSSKQVAYRPIIFEATSNRNNSATFAVTAVTLGNNAKARYAITNTTNALMVGDIITGSGFTGTGVGYNVRQTVMVVDAAWVETDLAYSVGSLGGQFITRTNDNIKLKGSVYVFDQAKFTIIGVTNLFGYAIIETSMPHGYSQADMAMIEATTDYNGSVQIYSIPDATHLLTNKGYVSSQTGTIRKGTFIGSKRQSPILVSAISTFRFDISNLLQSALTYDLLSTGAANLQTPNVNAIKWYALLLNEEYDAADGTVKSINIPYFTDPVISTAMQVVRAALQHLDTQSLTAFIIGSSSQRFLTNGPKTRMIRIGEEDQLSFLYPAPSTTQCAIAYQPYDLLGAPMAGSTLSLVTIIDGRAVAPINSNIITAAMSRVEVAIVNSGAGVLSETITYKIDRNSYTTAIRILFENYLGGFDAFTFTGAYKQINGNSKSSFSRDLGKTFSVSDRGETILGVNAETSFEVFSRFLTRAESTWLVELINGTNVFIQTSAGNIPITILNDSDVVDDTTGAVQMKLRYRYANAPITLSN